MKNELKDQLDPYFNGIKDLIKSTAESTKTTLRKEIKEGLAETQSAIKSVKEDVEANQRAIKSVKEDMIGMEGRLRSEMKDMEARLKNELASKEELKSMETRLSDKIDTRIDDHEAKPVNIAHRAA